MTIWQKKKKKTVIIVRERRKKLIIVGFFLLTIVIFLLSFVVYKGFFSSQRKGISFFREKNQKEQDDDGPEQEPKNQSPITDNELDKLISEQTEKPYFAYGLDMNTRKFKDEVGDVGKKFPAALPNHGLVFNKKKKKRGNGGGKYPNRSWLFYLWGSLFWHEYRKVSEVR